ncbi:DNA alkylation repair protein [Niveispirillum lacus]|uniref:DNA alkylation repair protein n=1 Tax=Niveispirillum lacus TaxID=1981099 RepID=A0A255YZJ1_9PROT|nr:DNA alkylation repair protein [Niveispirillum lacus]OYQ34626.1 DNA alkylation repair protein [Niveispirillum lacus]
MNDIGQTPLLKDLLGPAALARIAQAGEQSSPHFDPIRFHGALGDEFAQLSIMERVGRIGDALHAALPLPYEQAVAVVCQMGRAVDQGFQGISLSAYVARHGLEHPERSLTALADLTRFGSSEFAVRPFLIRHPDVALSYLRRFADDKDDHVRRLASEGTRPRLPWAARIPALTDDPALAAPILERLKADISPYVRKSVANHLNDITYRHPDWALTLMEGWQGGAAPTAWIIRHALRSLIKAGHPRALALVGAADRVCIAVAAFQVAPTVLRLGDRLCIGVEIVSTGQQDQRLVVDYRLHYARPGGKAAGKVFKLKNVDLPPGRRVKLEISQVIRDFSTRRHYPGRHRVELIINGAVWAEGDFTLLT